MSKEALQIAEKRREAKGKGEKERYTHLNAEFQRIARRNKNTRPPDLPPEKSICDQEAIVRTGHGTTDWFQIGKGVRQGCIVTLLI